MSWNEVLRLNSERTISAGSSTDLCDAIRRGADLRIYTEFLHNEHIDPQSDCDERIREVAEFPCTYLLEHPWVAGIMTLRQPIALPDGFGPRPSMSFFLYNQDGQQAIARPHLDGRSVPTQPGASSPHEHTKMPKYHELDRWDDGTNSPSSNFIYDFDVFRFFVDDSWREVLSHEPDGAVISGSFDALEDAMACGYEIKLGIQGLCADFAGEPDEAAHHEVFIRTGSNYCYTEQKLFLAGTHPVVRAKPAVPLTYTERGWDFGWLLVRTDGFVEMLLYDPYTLTPYRQQGHFAVRWFVRKDRD
jgi:hypothetical protein